MNECLTIDDDDEEDHSWYFSCSGPVQLVTTENRTGWHTEFLFYSCSGSKSLCHEVNMQIISLYPEKPDYCGLIAG